MLGFEADEAQARMLATASKRGLLNCTRQWGNRRIVGLPRNEAPARGLSAGSLLLVDEAARVSDSGRRVEAARIRFVES